MGAVQRGFRRDQTVICSLLIKNDSQNFAFSFTLMCDLFGVLFIMSDFNFRWDAFMCGLIAFTASFTVFEISFMRTSMDAMFWINRAVDCAFLIDIFLNFCRPYYYKNKRDPTKSRWVHRRRRIAVRYISTWFTIDCVSAIPFDAIVFLLQRDQSSAKNSSNFSVLRILKVLKLLKLFRVVKGLKILKRVVENSGLHNSTVRMWGFVLTCGLYIHWVACFFHMVPNLENPESVDLCSESVKAASWIEKADLCEATSVNLYLASLEFASMTLVVALE